MGFLIYLFIFLAKIIEVSIATVRIVLITRGERVLGACFGFFEVILWVILVSTVLTNITSDPIKVVIYALGFSIGNYVGSVVEHHIGIGNVRIEAIVMEEHGEELATKIRELGYAVTVIDGQGMNFERKVLLMNIKRKNHLEVVHMIKDFQSNVVITVNDIKPVYGGYGLIKR